MDRVVELLDKAKEKLGVDTDYKLAKELEIHQGLISDYRSGKRIPNAYACTKLAVVLDLDPMDLIAEMEMMSAKNEKQRRFWGDFLAQHGRAAALTLALASTLSYGIVGDLGTGQQNDVTSHYAK